MRVSIIAFVAILSIVFGSSSWAQTYPSRAITIVVALAPGTVMDTVVRLYADKLSQRLGKPVIVENRPGASQNIASGGVAQAIPDGHVLLAATSAPMAIQPTVYKQLPF